MTARELMLQLGLVDPDTPVYMLSSQGYVSRVRGLTRAHLKDDTNRKTIQITLISEPAILPEIDDMGRLLTG